MFKFIGVLREIRCIPVMNTSLIFFYVFLFYVNIKSLRLWYLINGVPSQHRNAIVLVMVFAHHSVETFTLAAIANYDFKRNVDQTMFSCSDKWKLAKIYNCKFQFASCFCTNTKTTLLMTNQLNPRMYDAVLPIGIATVCFYQMLSVNF